MRVRVRVVDSIVLHMFHLETILKVQKEKDYVEKLNTDENKFERYKKFKIASVF